MGTSEERDNHLIELRMRAEQVLKGQPIQVDDLTHTDIQYLLHELQVHQAELGIQNEELMRMQVEIELSRDRYEELYEFAPSGYCTITAKDNVLETNNTLAHILQVTKGEILNNHFSKFVAREDQDKYYLFRRRAFEKQQLSTELRLVKPDGERIYVRMESKVSGSDPNRLLIMLVDITEQRELQRQIIEQREQERKKIARDLHDGPVQALSAITFNLQGILMDHPDSEALGQSLEKIQTNLREQIQNLRNYSVDLRPPILDQLGLDSALRSYIEAYGAKNPNLNFRMSIEPISSRISQSASLALFRICQESLRNIQKHALSSATEVTIRLVGNEHNARLEVQDNGEGFELPEDWYELAHEGHFGLIGMRERAEAVGGQIQIQTRPGSGTSVRAVVPLLDHPEQQS